ncbi:hypothetical protein HZ996_00700 [Cryomorphaceae bacterium]|nr:hypothetical protein HZ996_00700 [Cryomorphaceae bacterium]
MRTLVLGLMMTVMLVGCTSTSSVNSNVNAVVSGEMLFSGPNSLQAPVSMSLGSLEEDLSIAQDDIRRVGVTAISVALSVEQAPLAESLLLQIVSNNQEMLALGTLSPLEGGTSFELIVAEDTDLLPFLKDEGATWVLDVNLTEDILDEMDASVDLNLMINYKN